MVTVRYFAAARAAAGVETETVQVPPGATVDILLKTVRAAHGDDLGRVLDRCSFLLDEVAVRDRDLPLHEARSSTCCPPSQAAETPGTQARHALPHAFGCGRSCSLLLSVHLRFPPTFPLPERQHGKGARFL